jgi:tetratricopeptide (TPR) repeat protein
MVRVREVGAVFVVLALFCACSNKKDDSNRLVNQALEKASQNDLSAAKSKLQLAIQSDPTNAAAYHTRAAILCKEGATADAIPDFEKAVELSKDNATWRYELAGKYWELYQAMAGDPSRDDFLPKIEEQISRAIELSPNLAEYYLLRARCRKAMMSFKGAATDYRKAIDIDPLEVGSYLELGRLYSLMWKVFYRDDLFGLAEQTLASADKLRDVPDLSSESQGLLPDMLFELAQLYAWRGNVEPDPAAAKGFREKAINAYVSIEEEYKDRSQLKLQLAQVFQQNGDTPKACTAAREAIQGIAGNDPQTAVLRNYVMNLEQEVCVTSTGYDPNR